MKDNVRFRKEVYEKYQHYKDIKEKKFFNRRFKFVEKSNNIQMIAMILICIVVMTGVVYASIYTYNKIWKKPKSYNYSEEAKITENDKIKYISQDEVVQKATMILTKLGYNMTQILEIQINKMPLENKAYWNIKTEDNLSLSLNAETGTLKSFTNNNLDDTKVKSIVNQNEAKIIAQDIYINLGYDNESYKLSSINKELIDAQSSLWKADFFKEYDGIKNIYQCIRIVFIPETKQMRSLIIFDEPFENNAIMVSRENAIEIVQNKDKEINTKYTISNIIAKLDIKKMNEYIYLKEKNNENTANVENDNQISKTEDTFYRTEGVIRKVWVVKIQYKSSEFDLLREYYVDVTTGEIIGGDGTT